MGKGKQYGAFLDYEGEITPKIQLSMMAEQLFEMEDLFSTPEFKGLTLADFKIEFIVKSQQAYEEEFEQLRLKGIKVPEKEPKHTVGWKITKK